MTELTIIPAIISITPTPEPEPPGPLPEWIGFEDRFERDGRWLLGPGVLGAIVRHMQGKSLVAAFDETSYRCNISLPDFPTVFNEIDDRRVDIYWTIPEELRPIFEACVFEALEFRKGDLEAVADEGLSRAMTPRTLIGLNMILQRREFERQYRRDPKDPELYQLLAHCFGIEWWNLAPHPFVDKEA